MRTFSFPLAHSASGLFRWNEVETAVYLRNKNKYIMTLQITSNTTRERFPAQIDSMPY